MKSKRITLSIGIPAHNEEKNIASLINATLSQKENSYKLESIFIICDGCTDKTAKIISKLEEKNKKIVLINDGLRLGKTARLNELFKKSKSEILLLMDGDILPKDKILINEIVKEFREPNIVLTGAMDLPVQSREFMARIIITSVNLWNEVRYAVNKKDWVHNIHGCIYAVDKKFYKQIEIPSNIVNDDTFLFLKAKELGFKSSFAKNAVVYYQAPSKLTDFYKQTNRFFVARTQIDNFFGPKTQKYFNIPPTHKKTGIINSFKKYPLFTILAIILQLSARFAVPFIKTQYNEEGIWGQIISTKKAIKL